MDKWEELEHAKKDRWKEEELAKEKRYEVMEKKKEAFGYLCECADRSGCTGREMDVANQKLENAKREEKEVDIYVKFVIKKINVIGCYSDMVEEACKVLKAAGKIPSSPERISDMLKKVFPNLNKGLLEDFEEVHEVYTFFHSITSIESMKEKGVDVLEKKMTMGYIDALQKKRTHFVNEMRVLEHKH